MIKVNIKWNSQKLTAECDTERPPIDFKAVIFSITGVPPHRQKVVVQGAVLGNEEWNIKLKNGQTIMMIGSSEEIAEPSSNDVPTKFEEDMNEEELKKSQKIPAGLVNLGNTCYMNATLQCLKTIPELRVALQSLSQITNAVPSQDRGLVESLSLLYKNMDNRMGGDFQPIVFLTALQALNPQFAERDSQGQGFAQQDANECWLDVVRRLERVLQNLPSSAFSQITGIEYSADMKINFVEKFMSGRFSIEMSRIDEESAPVPSSSIAATPTTNNADLEVTHTTETFTQLNCHILKDLKYLESGIRQGLTSIVTKRSELHNRECQFRRTLKIDRLPLNLAVQILRFSYKESKDLSVKILKEIAFPMELDLYEHCTPRLQAEISEMRAQLKQQADKLDRMKKSAAKKSRSAPSKPNSSTPPPRLAPCSLQDDPGASNSGCYELRAVLTHQGRSSRSGHYVGWVRDASSEQWFKCDDECVSPVPADSILRLAGGGDWHIAYVLLYGPRRLNLDVMESRLDEEVAADNSSAAMELDSAASFSKPLDSGDRSKS